MDRKSQRGAKAAGNGGGSDDEDGAAPEATNDGLSLGGDVQEPIGQNRNLSMEHGQLNDVNDTAPSVHLTPLSSARLIDNTAPGSSANSPIVNGSVSSEELDSLDMEGDAEAITDEYEFLLDIPWDDHQAKSTGTQKKEKGASAVVDPQEEPTDTSSRPESVAAAEFVALPDDEATSRILDRYPQLSFNHARHIANALAKGPAAFQKWCEDAMNQEHSPEGKAFKALWKLRQERTQKCKMCQKPRKGCGCSNRCKKCEKPRKDCTCRNMCRTHNKPKPVCGCKSRCGLCGEIKKGHICRYKDAKPPPKKKRRLKDPPPPPPSGKRSDDEEDDRKPAAKKDGPEGGDA
ncbi:MAG: hypothetical protein SGARI_004200, partial [Bacillariaceae sp.]